MHTPSYTAGTKYCYCFGYVTTNSTTVRLYVPFNVAEKLTRVTITNVKSDVRTTDGSYLGGSLSADITQYLTGTELLKDQGLIGLTFTKSNGFGLKNNTVLAGALNLTMSYTTK